MRGRTDSRVQKAKRAKTTRAANKLVHGIRSHRRTTTARRVRGIETWE
jgi:hypothetical protein